MAYLVSDMEFMNAAALFEQFCGFGLLIVKTNCVTL